MAFLKRVCKSDAVQGCVSGAVPRESERASAIALGTAPRSDLLRHHSRPALVARRASGQSCLGYRKRALPAARTCTQTAGGAMRRGRRICSARMCGHARQRQWSAPCRTPAAQSATAGARCGGVPCKAGFGPASHKTEAAPRNARGRSPGCHTQCAGPVVRTATMYRAAPRGAHTIGRVAGGRRPAPRDSAPRVKSATNAQAAGAPQNLFEGRKVAAQQKAHGRLQRIH